MEEEYIHKMNCPLCKGAIEFTESEVGVTGLCPACAGVIHFKRPPKPMTPRVRFIFGTLIPASAWILIIFGGLIYFNTDHELKLQKPAQRPPSTEEVIPDWARQQDKFADLIPARPQLPAGAWSATLVPFSTDPNLFRDPATEKKYRVQNGAIVEELNPYAGLTLQEIKLKVHLDSEIAQWKLDERRQQIEENRQDALVAELRRANNIASQEPPPIRRVLSYPTPLVSAPAPYVSPPMVTPLVTSYDPNSLANPYGAGSPYKADGLMNPYSQYGSPYSSKSWRNPYATDTPKLYDSQGNYRGKFSSNPYDADSTANPYGRYGSPYSPDSINNPYGAGNPYNTTPIYVIPSP